MTDPGLVPRPDLMLTATGGGYLRNPVRTGRVTCADCTTPVDGYERCFACQSHQSRTGLADAIAFLTYAVPDDLDYGRETSSGVRQRRMFARDVICLLPRLTKPASAPACSLTGRTAQEARRVALIPWLPARRSCAYSCS